MQMTAKVKALILEGHPFLAIILQEVQCLENSDQKMKLKYELVWEVASDNVKSSIHKKSTLSLTHLELY